jgi:hypothetical protein
MYAFEMVGWHGYEFRSTLRHCDNVTMKKNYVVMDSRFYEIMGDTHPLWCCLLMQCHYLFERLQN